MDLVQCVLFTYGKFVNCNRCSHNSELEERAQRAIDTFFSSNVIVPSPWTDSSKRKSFKLPQTPGKLLNMNKLSASCCKVTDSLTRPMPCHFQCNVDHRLYVSMQLCLVLPSLSSCRCIWCTGFITSIVKLFTSLSSLVALALLELCLVLSTVVLLWQCSHHFFTTCV